MASEAGYYLQLVKWGLERRAGGSRRYGKYVTKRGFEIMVRLPQGLTDEERAAGLRALAKKFGFDPPDE